MRGSRGAAAGSAPSRMRLSSREKCSSAHSTMSCAESSPNLHGHSRGELAATRSVLNGEGRLETDHTSPSSPISWNILTSRSYT